MRMKELMKKSGALLCAGLLLLTPEEVCAKSGSGSDSAQVPADAVSGGVIHSTVYGEVLVTRQADGTYNYTFFNDDWPAVQDLLRALNGGARIDLDKLLTESSTYIRDIMTDDKRAIANDIVNSGAASGGNRGSFTVGSEYGTDLNENEIRQVQTLVSSFMLTNNVVSLNEAQKVRKAHDYLVQTCRPAPMDTQNHRDNAWGALIYHEANAKGYARAMKALCDSMGVGCYIVSANNSSTLKDYMWNVVLINGEWFIVDVYCDDSISSYTTYLISDSAYQALGMRWDAKDGVPPECKRNYQ